MSCPVSIDHQACSECGTCVELCPEVFGLDEHGAIQVLEPEACPWEDLEQAVAWCPEQCIHVEGAGGGCTSS